MEWRKIQRTEAFLEESIILERSSLTGDINKETSLDGDIYKDNLLVLGVRVGLNNQMTQDHVLCCWNIKTNTWSSFDIQRLDDRKGNLIVYKNLLISCQSADGLGMAILNLENVDFKIPKSAEENRIISLFMSEEDSDIAFKIQDQIIPAHKQILIEKSKYFSNLFNSEMIESRQEILEIQDSEYLVFKG